MNRVLQTAGRVIRSEDDRGMVVLVDPRFRERRYRELMPVEWQVQEANTSRMLRKGVAEF